MPIHDWSQVQAGIYHDFHHAWIERIKETLNSGILPPDYYALAEQHAGGYGPDVLTLQGTTNPSEDIGVDIDAGSPADGEGGLLLAAPPARLTAETDMQFYRRKQNVVAVRHVTGDRVVAFVEIVSPGNKSNRRPFVDFVDKVARLLDQGIHVLILDLLPPTPRDPNGIHAAIWEEVAGEEFVPPSDKPLTLVSYESALAIRAYIEPVAVGDDLPNMPLFLRPGAHVSLPVDDTYQAAWKAVPQRWRRVIEGGATGSL